MAGACGAARQPLLPLLPLLGLLLLLLLWQVCVTRPPAGVAHLPRRLQQPRRTVAHPLDARVVRAAKAKRQQQQLMLLMTQQQMQQAQTLAVTQTLLKIQLPAQRHAKAPGRAAQVRSRQAPATASGTVTPCQQHLQRPKTGHFLQLAGWLHPPKISQQRTQQHQR